MTKIKNGLITPFRAINPKKNKWDVGESNPGE